MKTLAITTYIVGSILLIAACFASTESATWWLGGIALLFLVLGCIFQFNSLNRLYTQRHRH